MATSQYLTEDEVADKTRISVKTLRRWRLEKRGPTFHKFGSLVRYSEEELDRWAEAHRNLNSEVERMRPKAVRPTPQLRQTS